MKKPKLRELGEAVRAVFSRRYTTKYPFEPHEPPDGFRGEPQFDPDVCVGCTGCEEVCPAIAISHVDDYSADPPVRTIRIRTDKCIFCGQCELNCTTHGGVKLSKNYDMATTDRASLRQTVQHELVLCEVCGGPVGTRRHLQWVARKLGAKAYANPTLIMAADATLAEAPAPGARTSAPAVPRNDTMRMLCTDCRRTVVVRETWGG